jgi:hypothetical protein
MSNRNDPEPANTDRPTAELDDPRAVDILTTEHWSLLSTRTLGYQEMFIRATIFVAILSGTVVALALLAQATNFRRETLWFALMLISLTLFIGAATFVRSLAINYEDARWVTGMNLLRRAYLQIVPELEAFFVTDHEPDAEARSLGEGSPQRFVDLIDSLTTTSGVVAALNSLLAGALASDLWRPVRWEHGPECGARSWRLAPVGGTACPVRGSLSREPRSRCRSKERLMN